MSRGASSTAEGSWVLPQVWFTFHGFHGVFRVWRYSSCRFCHTLRGLINFIRKKVVQFYVLVDTINAVDTNHPTLVDYRFQMLGFRDLAIVINTYTLDVSSVERLTVRTLPICVQPYPP